MDVADWLRALGLERYEATFRENDVDAELLRKLTADDLKELGITSLGHRRYLLEAIAALYLEGPLAGGPVRLSSQRPTTPTGSHVSSETAAERRPLSVMFCDLVGSTVLSSRLDAEDLREVIRAYQASVATTIQPFDGFIARYVGDGVLIYFGWPEARETDSERAVRAGLAVAAAVSAAPVGGEPLQVRIGIATGLVVIGEPIGSGDSRQQTAVGETPNLAARLQGLAGPNQVVIDAATRRQIGGLFECQDLGTVELKGLPVAVPAWQVRSENRTLGQFEALHGSTMTPLVGRDEEMELLLRRWAQAKAGNGRVVLISAEPGVGKSRLAEALTEQIAAEPHIRLRYFCSPHHQDSGLYPVIAQMERAAGLAQADGPAARLTKLQAVLASTAPPREDVALIVELHGLPSADLAPPLDVTPQRKKDKTFEALLRQVEGLSRQQPVLMMFDDIHWIDPSSRELLDRVAERVADWPVLLLAMFRPEFQPPWTGQPHVTMLTLARLDRRNTAAMIANVAGNAALPAEIVQEIAERTDGVPLFIEELTKAVLESGAQGAAALSSMPHPGLSVPAALHASLMARLDRLGLAAKDIAQKGSVIGREFSYELLDLIADLPEPQLQEALQLLTSSGLLFTRGTAPQSVYLFKHALVQDAAYGTLLRSRRQNLHGRMAAALEAQFPERAKSQPELLAHHFTEAMQTERAIEYWKKAGQQALARSAMIEAGSLLRKGLSLVSSLSDNPRRREHELDLQIPLGRVVLAVQGFGAPEAAEIYARARLVCEQIRPHKLLPVVFGQWIYHLNRGDMERARELAADIRQLGEIQDDIVARVAGCRASGSTCTYIGDFAGAREYLEQGLSLYDPVQRPSHAELAPADTFVSMSAFLLFVLTGSGHLNQAQSLRDATFNEARRLAHAFTLTYALYFAWQEGWAARSEPAELLQLADEILALSNEGGFAFWRALALAARGWCLSALGQTEEGIPLITTGLADVRATGATLNTPDVLIRLADAYRMAGRPEPGLTHLAEAKRFAEKTQTKWVQAEALRLEGDLVILAGDHTAAEASFRDAIALAQRQGAKLFELRASTSLARLWRDQGKHAEARDLVAPIYQWFTEGFDAPDLKDAKALLAFVQSRAAAPQRPPCERDKRRGERLY